MVKKLKKRDKISVIIRTKNEARWIGHAIQSVLDNLYKPEIIIVDNFSTDETINIVRQFLQDPNLADKNNRNYVKIKIFKIESYTPGKSLNFAVSKCSNDLILILSAHCVLKKFNFDHVKKEMKKFSCIFGKQNPIYFGKKINKRYIWSHFLDKRIVNMYSQLEKRYFFHNALAIYSKKILKKYKFDENLAGKEDRYWINEFVKKKYKFLYDPNLEADHHYTINGNTWKGIG